MFNRSATLLASASIAALAITACSADNEDSDADAAEGSEESQETYVIGVANEHEAHRELERIAEEEHGFDIELVNFTDYNQPNPALSNGDLDANWFQHIAFLAEHNTASGDNLQPIGATEIVPLTLYSNEYDDVEDFQDGDTIAIPNDPVNQGRAINVLVAAGLVELSEDLIQPEVRHVDQDASTVQLEELDAAQTVNALQSVDGALINNNFAQDADLDPEEEGIFSDDPSDPSAFPFINTFVTTEENVDNEDLREIASIYHDERVVEIMDERSNGTSIPVDDVSVEELQDALVEYEENLQEGEG